MINELDFKNRKAVSIQSSSLKAVFLPQDGAKMVSLVRLRDKKELLAVKPGDTYLTLSYDGDYVSSECSGFDDMFPTVDPHTPSTGPYSGVTYPDHGEMCRIPHGCEITDDSIVFQAKSRLFPVSYKKRVSVQDESILLSYTIENLGNDAFDFLWAGHIMLQGEDGIKLITPFDEDAKTEFMFAPVGADVTLFPKDALMGFVPGKGPAYKFYYTEPMKEGYFGVKYPDDSELVFEFDKEKLPYLGIWLNNGEFQNIYTVTPEPCTVPFDSPDRAAKRGFTSVIPPHEIYSFEIKITGKEIHNL